MGLAAAQCSHAAFEFSRQYPVITRRWMADSNFIVLVTAINEDALRVLVAQASSRGIRHITNAEPDLNNQLTAVVLAPGQPAQRLCASLPLLGREMAMT
jgi:hypothetical protein